MEIIIADRGRSTAELNNFVAPNMTQAGDIKKEGVVIQTDAADANAELVWTCVIMVCPLSLSEFLYQPGLVLGREPTLPDRPNCCEQREYRPSFEGRLQKRRT
eukprot:scaffold9551_cov169-Skeletonema_menzelii.AAC.1